MILYNLNFDRTQLKHKIMNFEIFQLSYNFINSRHLAVRNQFA